VKDVRRIAAARTRPLRRATAGGSPPDQRRVDAPPAPCPAGRRWLQDLGCLALTLDRVESIRPTQQPRGRGLPRVPNAANRRIARRRVRLEPVHSRVKRWRSGHDTSRFRKVGARDLVLDVCGARHNVRGRLTPWPPMISSG
jgi:hypothetical protein